MKTIGIVPARMDSKRLPSKALREVLGRPLVQYVIERARRVRSLAAIVVATSARPVDDALADHAQRLGAEVFRGSAHNVAERCASCARRYAADFFVRLNADSPFPDPMLIEQGLGQLTGPVPADLVSNLPGRTFPYGISVEVVNVTTLLRILPTLGDAEAEHVTRRFYEQPDRFAIRRLVSSRPELRDARLVVDTEDDLAAFLALARSLGPRVLEASFDEVAALALAGRQRARAARPQDTAEPR
jgi:spore coat polysaccharide biosynthesis protein SpsF